MLAETLHNLGIEIAIWMWVAGIAVVLLFVALILHTRRR